MATEAAVQAKSATIARTLDELTQSAPTNRDLEQFARSHVSRATAELKAAFVEEVVEAIEARRQDKTEQHEMEKTAREPHRPPPAPHRLRFALSSRPA